MAGRGEVKRIRLLKDLGPGCLEGTEHDVISEERIPPAAHEPPGGRLVRAFFYSFYSGGEKVCAALPDEFEYVEDQMSVFLDIHRKISDRVAKAGHSPKFVVMNKVHYKDFILELFEANGEPPGVVDATPDGLQIVIAPVDHLRVIFGAGDEYVYEED